MWLANELSRHEIFCACSLETTLRNFSCLTVGDNIMVAYNNKKYYIDIIEAKPAQAISIIETDCEVDFAPPLDYKEPSRPNPEPKAEAAAASGKTAAGAGGAGAGKEGTASTSWPYNHLILNIPVDIIVSLSPYWALCL